MAYGPLWRINLCKKFVTLTASLKGDVIFYCTIIIDIIFFRNGRKIKLTSYESAKCIFLENLFVSKLHSNKS